MLSCGRDECMAKSRCAPSSNVAARHLSRSPPRQATSASIPDARASFRERSPYVTTSQSHHKVVRHRGPGKLPRPRRHDDERLRDHRAGSPGYRHRCLRVFLSDHQLGCDAQAVHQPRTRQGSRPGADEHVQQRAHLSSRRRQGCGPLQFRHALFVGLPRPLQGTDGGLGAGYRRALLPPADARHVDRCVRVAGLAHDGNAGW